LSDRESALSAAELRALPPLSIMRTFPPKLSSPRQAGRRVYISWPAISSRAHELECVDNLFAIRMFMDLARGPVGEFVLVMRWKRIAEHQRVNDPDCAWLHCLPPCQMDRPRSMHAPCQ